MAKLKTISRSIPFDDWNSKTITFSANNAINFTIKDISDKKLTGEMRRKHKLSKTNVISSFIDDLNAEQVSFYNSDIKDSRIINSSFEKSNFNHASHNNNWLKDCQFSSCTFSQTAITLSDFENCTFLNCDFTHVIISDCKFTNCSFGNCITSNKLIESSLILNCSFQSMLLQPELIYGNFGLTINDLEGCSFSKSYLSKKNAHDHIQNKIVNALSKETNSIQRFKLQYFLTPKLITEISEDLDNLFNIESWLKLCRNPNRFKLSIEKLHEFLMYQFEADNLRLRTLIQLSITCSRLSDFISKQSELIDILRTTDGIFLTLERLLEKYISLTETLTRYFDDEGYCRILVEGPLEKEFYEQELKDLLSLAPVTFGKVIKHNSPNELYIHWEDIRHLWPILLFIMSSKMKIELNKLDQIASQIRSPKNKILRSNQIFKIESGFLEGSDSFSFRLQSLLPGHHELTIVMQLSADRYKKIMRIVKDIVVFDKKKTPENII